MWERDETKYVDHSCKIMMNGKLFGIYLYQVMGKSSDSVNKTISPRYPGNIVHHYPGLDEMFGAQVPRESQCVKLPKTIRAEQVGYSYA